MGRSVVAGAVAFVIVLGGLIPPAASAGSYGCYSGGRNSRSFNVKYVNVSDNWASRFDDARSRWNSAGAGAFIGRSSDSTATMSAGRYTGQSWYGHYTTRKVNLVMTFTIEVNWLAIQSDSPEPAFWTWVASTSTHELGHSLRLNDNPPTASVSLMKHGRNRATVVSPQSYDVQNVLACY